MHVRQAAQVKVVRSQAAGRLAFGAFDFRKLQLRCDRSDDACRDAVLKIKNVLKRAVEPVRPEMRTAGGVDELAVDTNALASLSHATFQDLADTQVAPH